MTLDTDRIATGNELYALAEMFADEAEQWKGQGERAELQRSARQLAEIARHTTGGTADLERAQAFAEAADLLIRQIRGARRFFQVVASRPRPRGNAA